MHQDSWQKSIFSSWNCHSDTSSQSYFRYSLCYQYLAFHGNCFVSINLSTYSLKVNWNAETSWPLSRDSEALKTVSKEFLKNLFSFSRYRLLKSKNSVGQILGFHRFSKNIVGRFLSLTSLMIFSLGTKLSFIGNTLIFFPQSQAPRKSILKIFTEYFSSV